MPTLLLRFLSSIVLALLGAVLSWGAAADDFLPPEQAFRFEARALDERQVEVVFTVADGYYLYRDRFAFAADGAGVRLGTALIPPGKVKFDETFGKELETHRGRVVIRVPVEGTPAAFTLNVTSQGCADAGLCYPPMQSSARMQLTAASGGAGAAPDVDTASSGIEGALRGGHLWAVVGVFFGAGLLLSLTPCVLPMLPILSSIIVGQNGVGSHPSRSRGFGLALAYSFGMALIYTALGIAAGLAGEGLAAALQNPWVLGAFASMLAALSLSMFGFYELQLPSGLRDRLDARAHRLQGGRWLGVFAMGGLSALIVSPCVAAPLAGALLYISQSRDVVLGGSALFSLAAGMSVPLLLVGASAGALLPQAGAWMESVKRFFGVLLLAVAWWIVSPVLPGPLTLAGWGLLSLLAASMFGAFDRLTDAAGAGRRVAKACSLALAVLGAAQIVGAMGGSGDALQPLQRWLQPGSMATGSSPGTATTAPVTGTHFQRVSDVAELDAALRSAGRPVMLDFYADWCVSCKEMERFTFSDPRVRARLDRMLLLQVDVTRNSPADRELLKRFGLFGPPGIVFFDAQGNELASPRVIGYQDADRFLDSLQRAGS